MLQSLNFSSLQASEAILINTIRGSGTREEEPGQSIIREGHLVKVGCLIKQEEPEAWGKTVFVEGRERSLLPTTNFSCLSA